MKRTASFPPAWSAALPEATPCLRWRDRLADRLHAWRDKRLMDPRFQRLAARFPLSRPFARRSASALFDLTAGFVYAQILKACVELDLFALLAERPATATELAQRAGLTADGAQRLLLAATALGLVGKRSQGRFGLAMLGAALQGNAGVRAMIRHHGLLYGDLADPVALLRGGT